MMDCGEIRNLLLDVDGRPDRLEAGSARDEACKHVEACASCAREAELLRKFADSAKRAKAVAPPGFTLRVMERVHAEAAAARPLWRRIADLLLAPRMAPAFGMALLLLLAAALYLALPKTPVNDDSMAAIRRDRNVPKVAPAPETAPAVAHHVPQAPETVSEFTLDSAPLAYAVAHSLRKGQTVAYRGELAAIEILEDANLMFVEGELQLVDGVVRVASNGKDLCKLVASTDAMRVTMTGTAFELGCRCGLSHCSVQRGSVAVRTASGDSFSLAAGESAHVSADGARLAPNVGASAAADANRLAGATEPKNLPVHAAGATAEVGVGTGSGGTDAVPVRNLLDQLQNQGIQ